MVVNFEGIDPLFKWSLGLADGLGVKVRLCDPLVSKSYAVEPDGHLGDIEARHANGCYYLDELKGGKVRPEDVRSLLGRGWLHIDSDYPNLEYSTVHILPDKPKGLKKLFRRERTYELPKYVCAYGTIVDSSIKVKGEEHLTRDSDYIGGTSVSRTEYITLKHDFDVASTVVHELTHKWVAGKAFLSPSVMDDLRKEMEDPRNAEVVDFVDKYYSNLHLPDRNGLDEGTHLDEYMNFLDEFTAHWFTRKFETAVSDIPKDEDLSARMEKLDFGGNSLAARIYDDLKSHSFSLDVRNENKKRYEDKNGIKSSVPSGNEAVLDRVGELVDGLERLSRDGVIKEVYERNLNGDFARNEELEKVMLTYSYVTGSSFGLTFEESCKLEERLSDVLGGDLKKLDAITFMKTDHSKRFYYRNEKLKELIDENGRGFETCLRWQLNSDKLRYKVDAGDAILSQYASLDEDDRKGMLIADWQRDILDTLVKLREDPAYLADLRKQKRDEMLMERCVDFSCRLDDCDALVPGSRDRLWGCPPYSVVAIEFENMPYEDGKPLDESPGFDYDGFHFGHIDSVTIENGDGDIVTFSGDEIDEDNRLTVELNGMTVKYGFENGKAEFVSEFSKTIVTSRGRDIR